MAVKGKTEGTGSTPARRADGAARHRLRHHDATDEASRQVPSSPFSIANIRSSTLNSLGVKIMLGFLILIFAVGFAITALQPGPAGQSGGGSGGSGPVATVGAQTIERDQFEAAAVQQARFMEQFGQTTGPAELLRSRQQTLQSLTDRAALIEAAKADGMTASDDEIEKKMNELIDEQVKGQREQLGEANFRRQVESQFGSQEEFRAKTKESFDRDRIAEQVLLDKLEKKIKDGNKVGEADYKRSQTKLLIRQLLVRPKLPAPNAKDVKIETDKNAQEAKTRADKIAADLKAKPTKENFIALVKQHSEDITTKTKGGLMGWKLPAELPYPPEMQQDLMKATGNIVGPLENETTKEYSIFFIENRAERLPPDYAKNKKKTLEDYEKQQDETVWSKYQQDVREKTKVRIEDPALAAYKIQSEQLLSAQPKQQEELRKQALDLYQEALDTSEGSEAAAVHYQMAQLYRDMQQPEKVVASLQAASKGSTQPTQVDVELARALRESNKKQEALAKLTEVSKKLDETPSAPSPFGGNPQDMLRTQIALEYDALGQKDKAALERKKITPPGAGGMGGMPGMGGIGGLPGGLNFVPPSGAR